MRAVNAAQLLAEVSLLRLSGLRGTEISAHNRTVPKVTAFLSLITLCNTHLVDENISFATFDASQPPQRVARVQAPR